MPLTTSDLHTSLAYRLGENSAPSDSTTKAIRLEWMNDGYFTIARRRYWWWLQASDTSNTNTGSTTGYSEPSDLREFIELKISDIWYDQIPYRLNRNYNGTSPLVTLPSLRTSYQFYRYAGKYYFTVTDAADAATHYIKYYKKVSKVTDGNSFLLPDEFTPALTAYAEARYWLSITQQAKAQAPFQEFEEVVKELERENSRRGTGWSAGFGITQPEQQFPE